MQAFNPPPASCTLPMLLVKLGGSVITVKSKYRTLRGPDLSRLARELAAATDPTGMIVVHGAGSYGHILAAKHRLGEGYADPAQLGAVAQVQRDVRALELKVLDPPPAAPAPPRRAPPEPRDAVPRGPPRFLRRRALPGLPDAGVPARLLRRRRARHEAAVRDRLRGRRDPGAREALPAGPRPVRRGRGRRVHRGPEAGPDGDPPRRRRRSGPGDDPVLRRARQGRHWWTPEKARTDARDREERAGRADPERARTGPPGGRRAGRGRRVDAGGGPMAGPRRG